MMFQDGSLPGGAVNVCVDLRGQYALVAEHFLYGPEICAVFYQMGGK